MKKWICFFCLLAGSTGFAQPFTIDAFTIAGGGGTSSGGQFALSGTVGQTDPGQLSGGNFTLGMVTVVESSGSPRLTVRIDSSGIVAISWPAPSTGFLLEENAALGTPDWLSVTNTINTTGGQNEILVSPAIGTRFYRLRSP